MANVATPNEFERVLKRGRMAWEVAASQNAMRYIDTRIRDWRLDEFLDSGEALAASRVDPILRKAGINAGNCLALDIGCGLGRLSRALSFRFASVVGVDISSTMVTRAREINADRPNVRFLANSGCDLPIDGATCDFCFSALTFQHIPSTRIIERYFEEISRVLVPGGSFLVQIAWPLRSPILNLGHNLAVRSSLWRFAQLLTRRTRDLAATSAFPGACLSPTLLARFCVSYNMELMETFRAEPPDHTYWSHGRRRRS